MSILGLTIDYGPFGFLDGYDPDHICNSTGKSDFMFFFVHDLLTICIIVSIVAFIYEMPEILQ